MALRVGINSRLRGQRPLTRDSDARRWSAVTVMTMSERRDRTKPAAVAHVYTTPVVREIPSQPVEMFDSRIW
jgi:hypothetical protein